MEVVGCILVVLVFVLICPVQLDVRYDGNFSAKLRLLFLIPIRLYPPKEKNKKSNEKQQKKQQQKQQKSQQQSPQGSLRGFADMLESMLEKAKNLLAHCKVKKLSLRVNLAGEDAAAVALEYGAACAIVYPLLGVIARYVIFRPEEKQHSIELIPMFNGGESSVYAAATLSFLPPVAMIVIFSALWEYLLKNKLKENKLKKSAS